MAGSFSKTPREKVVESLKSLPVGCRFHPTDEELVNHFLPLKIEGKESEVEVIQEVDVCKWEPWELAEQLKIRSDDSEWFCFYRLDRKGKHPNGVLMKRSTKRGFWKSTGQDRHIKSRSSGMNLIATKKTLVFYIGRAPKGEKTNWIMHEYRIKEKENDGTNGKQGADLVICRLKKPDESTENSNGDEIGSSRSSPIATKFSPEATSSKQVTASDIRDGRQQSNNSSYIQVRVIDGEVRDMEVDPLLDEEEDLRRIYETLGSISPKHDGLGSSYMDSSFVVGDYMEMPFQDGTDGQDISVVRNFINYSRGSGPCDSRSTYRLGKQVHELASSVSRISLSQEEPKAKTKPEEKTEEKKDVKAEEKREEPKKIERSTMKFRGVDEQTKQEEPKTETKPEEKREEKEGAKPTSPVVLLVDLHCEGCAKKVEQSIKAFSGVEEVTIDIAQNQVTVKGEVDPQALCLRIQKKTKKTVKILSPLPAAEGEPIPEVVTSQVSGLTTVELNVNIQSEACAQELKREILKIRGVQTAETELSTGKVTVTGTIDGNRLVDYVYRHTNKQAQIVQQPEPEKKVEQKEEGKRPAEEAPKHEVKKEETAEEEEEEKHIKERKEGRRESRTRKKDDSNNENNGREEKSGSRRIKKQAQIVPQPEPEKQAEKKEEGEKPEEEAAKPEEKKEDTAEKKEKEKLVKKIKERRESTGTRKKDEPKKEGEENNNGGETTMNYDQWDRVPRLPPPPQLFSDENPNACCIS